MEKILTVNDVATILQVKAITVREMFREKRLRGFKVGKSWRTTETMLQEDIDALARGESPAALPMPSNPAPAPDQPEAADPPAPPEKAPAAPKPAGDPAEDTATTDKPRPDRKPSPPKEPPRPNEKDSGDDDTQQMLF